MIVDKVVFNPETDTIKETKIKDRWVLIVVRSGKSGKEIFYTDAPIEFFRVEWYQSGAKIVPPVLEVVETIKKGDIYYHTARMINWKDVLGAGLEKAMDDLIAKSMGLNKDEEMSP